MTELKPNNSNRKPYYFLLIVVALAGPVFAFFMLNNEENQAKVFSNKEPPAAVKDRNSNDLEELFNKAERLRKQWDYTEALTLYQSAAESGHLKSQAKLAEIYSTGIGNRIPQDIQLSTRWGTLAAEQGDIDAQFFLAVLYESRHFDYQKASYWYEKAAAQGSDEATIGISRIRTKLIFEQPELARAAGSISPEDCSEAKALTCPGFHVHRV